MTETERVVGENIGLMGGEVVETRISEQDGRVLVLKECAAANSILNCKLEHCGFCSAHIEGVDTNGKPVHCGVIRKKI